MDFVDIEVYGVIFGKMLNVVVMMDSMKFSMKIVLMKLSVILVMFLKLCSVLVIEMVR